MRTVEEVKPAHLRFVIEAITWADIEAAEMTWAMLEEQFDSWAALGERLLLPQGERPLTGSAAQAVRRPVGWTIS